MKKSILIAVAVLAGGIINAQSVVLKFNPANGSKYGVSNSATSVIKQNMMGQEMEVKSNYTEDANLAISDSADVKKVAYTFSKIALNMSMMGQDIKMASDAAEESDGNKLFKSFIGNTITVVVNSAGNVLKIYGLEAIKAKAASVKQGEIMNTYLSESVFKTRIEQLFNMVPGKAVKPGETWTSLQTVSSPFPISNTMVYKLNTLNANDAVVDISGTSTTNGDQATQIQGMDMKVNMAGTNTGKSVIDAVTGMVKSLDLTSIMKGRLNVMGQEVPMDVTTKGLITVTKK